MTLALVSSVWALGLHTPGCAGPSRFKVDKVAWFSARAARRALPIDMGRGAQRYLRPEYVALACGYDEDEIAVPDPGLPLRRWGVGSMWTGVGLAGVSLLPFAASGIEGLGSLGADTAEERREVAEKKSRGDVAGWTLLGMGGVLFFVGGILLAMGHGKADEILLPVGVDPFAAEKELDVPALEPRGPDEVDRRQGRLPALQEGADFRTEQAEAIPHGCKENVEKRPERSQSYVRTYRRHLKPQPWGSAKACDGRKSAPS